MTFENKTEMDLRSCLKQNEKSELNETNRYISAHIVILLYQAHKYFEQGYLDRRD